MNWKPAKACEIVVWSDLCMWLIQKIILSILKDGFITMAFELKEGKQFTLTMHTLLSRKSKWCIFLGVQKPLSIFNCRRQVAHHTTYLLFMMDRVIPCLSYLHTHTQTCVTKMLRVSLDTNQYEFDYLFTRNMTVG